MCINNFCVHDKMVSIHLRSCKPCYYIQMKFYMYILPYNIISHTTSSLTLGGLHEESRTSVSFATREN